MLDKSLFSYSDYKKYLRDRIKVAPNAGRGFRKELSDTMGCQQAYLSHVMNGERHLSVEQAEAATHYLGLSENESEYFIWLVERARAGTKGSQVFFDRLINEKRSQYLQFKERVAITEDLDKESKGIYYSTPLYSAIHILTTIPEYRDLHSISKRLNISTERASEIINFLKSKGLIEEKNGKLYPLSKLLFLEKSSEFIDQHHKNWRMEAINSIAKRQKEDLHLSLTVSLSNEDRKLIQQKIVQFVEEMSEQIKQSKEEELLAFNLDFFEV